MTRGWAGSRPQNGRSEALDSVPRTIRSKLEKKLSPFSVQTQSPEEECVWRGAGGCREPDQSCQGRLERGSLASEAGTSVGGVVVPNFPIAVTL